MSTLGDQARTSLKNVLEALLLASGEPLSLATIASVFSDEEQPGNSRIGQALQELGADYEERGLELKEVASGFRLQVRQEVSPWVTRLREERPQRYSRALLETLALIAYRQPITRGDIEEVRGVSVRTNIIRTLQEREWIRVIGHRDVPGKPALFGTTKVFLDYFNLMSLDDLPSLAEIMDMGSLEPELELEPVIDPELVNDAAPSPDSF
jgi:segregation and condensation protein B